MAPITTPEKPHCDSRVRSMAVGSSALRRQDQVAGLEFRREDDLYVGKRLLRFGVLSKQDGRTPLLPVGPLAACEANGPVPPFELVVQQALDQVSTLGALDCVEGVCQQDDLDVGVKGTVDRLLLKLLLICLTEGLTSRRKLHGRVIVHNVSQIASLVAQVLPVLGSYW